MGDVVNSVLNGVAGVLSSSLNPIGAITAAASGHDPIMDPAASWQGTGALLTAPGGNPNAMNFLGGSSWAPAPGVSSASFASDPTSVFPPSLTAPAPAAQASGGGTPSTGTAGSPSAMSPNVKSAITGSIAGQLPGLVAADEAGGLTGLSPQFLAGQAGEASGFTNQQTLIAQAVANWLKSSGTQLP